MQPTKPVAAGEAARPGAPALSRPIVLWPAALAAIFLLYWVCLRFVFPGYFAPLSAFHEDFYVYMSTGDASFSQLLFTFPRPVCFAALKVMAYLGLTGLMAGGIAIALLNVALTLAVWKQIFRLSTAWMRFFFALYTLLLFAHPDFYIEHRHDLPAELSYLFFAVSLLAWLAWLRRRGNASGITRAALLAVVFGGAFLFVFTKESYFLAVLCMVAGLAMADREDRRRHAAYLGLLVILEAVSFAWTKHINGPFVNVSAAGSDPYHISLAPASLAHGFLFYAARLFNPWLAAAVCLGVFAVWRDRRRLILALAAIAAGIGVFGTHAILPNHLYEEYAWAAAPPMLAPILLLCLPSTMIPWRSVRVALGAGLALLAILGPWGYRRAYGSDVQKWLIGEDHKGLRMAQSIPRLKQIPTPAHILVVGLEDAAVPWQSAGYLSYEFSRQAWWTVALPPSIGFRRNSKLAQFVNATDVRLADFDYVAAYRADGTLTAVRPVKSIPAGEPAAETLVPALGAAQAAALARPGDSAPLVECASVAARWGLWGEADGCLAAARRAGASGPAYNDVLAEMRARPVEMPKPSPGSELTAVPARAVQPDGSGLAVVELRWKTPGGIASEIHVDAPDGPMFTSGSSSGSASTGKWVSNGMRFFLQDVTGGKPLTAEHTLAQARVEVTR